MQSRVLQTIRQHELVRPGELVLVAVSGGPDSMALLHVLWEASARLDVRLQVVTVDHGLRPAARTEGALVRARATELGLPWHGVAVDVAAAARGRASLQDAARRARLSALEELAARLGAARVALGHQADDQAETILFRIVRGTGLRGLAGIPYARGPFIRPLLDVTRAEVARYLARRSIPFVEDPSNADLRFARARVRHQLLPLLARENPRVREALNALAAEARGPSVVAGAGLPPDVGRRAAAVVARLRASGAGTRSVDVAGGRIVEVAYGKVSVGVRSVGVRRPRLPTDEDETVVVAGPGTYTLAGGVTSLRLSEREGEVTFDADLLAWPLSLRRRRPGDRMRPRGGRGSRKVADLLIDAKVARAARADLPVLTTAEGVILYVPGLRPAENGRPKKTTTRFLSVTSAPAG